MPDEIVARPVHPHVAHYDEPDLPDDEEARRDAEALAQAEHDSSRRMDFARWRAARYVAGVFLACVSIAGGAVAVMAVIAALTSGAGPVDLVTGIEDSGVGYATLTSGQLFLLAGALVALEVVLVWATTLLFSRGLHPGQWVVHRRVSSDRRGFASRVAPHPRPAHALGRVRGSRDGRAQARGADVRRTGG